MGPPSYFLQKLLVLYHMNRTGRDDLMKGRDVRPYTRANTDPTLGKRRNRYPGNRSQGRGLGGPSHLLLKQESCPQKHQSFHHLLLTASSPGSRTELGHQGSILGCLPRRQSCVKRKVCDERVGIVISTPRWSAPGPL